MDDLNKAQNNFIDNGYCSLDINEQCGFELNQIQQLLTPFNALFWSYIIRYGDVELDLALSEPKELVNQHYTEAKRAFSRGEFTFFFRRICHDNGLDLPKTDALDLTYQMLTSDIFIAILSKLVKRNIGAINQLYINLFDKGDFLTTHSDSGNNIGIAINITPQWNPNFGGITHIINSCGDIVDSLTPSFGRLFIFDSTNKFHVPHFVSMVNTKATNKRMAIIARYD